MSKVNEFAAAPAAVGYLYQCRLALLLLLRKSLDADLAVSLECLDDIVFESDGTPQELIQVKHSIRAVSDLSDASPRMWKTLRIWSERLARQEVDIRSTCLKLITVGVIANGTAASYLQADSRNLEIAEELLLRAASSTENEENKAGIEAFTKLSQKQRKGLLSNVYIIGASPNIVQVEAALQSEFKHAAPTDLVPVFVQQLEGWWFSRVVNQLTGNASSISRIDLQLAIDDIREQLKRQSLPVPNLSVKIPSDEGVNTAKENYVEQIRLIEFAVPVIRNAIGDYLKSAAARSEWVREQLISTRELTAYFDELESEWSSRFELQRSKLSSDCDEPAKVSCGKQVYEDVQFNLTIPLRNRNEGYLMRGAFHELANRLQIGWHPEYTERIASSLKGQ